MTEPGLYWHVHHDVLYEWCYDAEGRREYIRTEKPEEEREIRLRLMKPVNGALGDAKARAVYGKTVADIDKTGADYAKTGADLDKALAHCAKALADYVKARADYAKARADYAKARADLDKARADLDKARADYAKAWADLDKARAAWEATVKPGEAEALHATECPNCPWNGKTIFPEKP